MTYGNQIWPTQVKQIQKVVSWNEKNVVCKIKKAFMKAHAIEVHVIKGVQAV